jgi:hypothetical protein
VGSNIGDKGKWFKVQEASLGFLEGARLMTSPPHIHREDRVSMAPGDNNLIYNVLSRMYQNAYACTKQKVEY